MTNKKYVTKEQLDDYKTLANLSMQLGFSLARLERKQAILVTAHSVLSDGLIQDEYIANTFNSYLEESKEIIKKIQRDVNSAVSQLETNHEQNRNS